jgi:CheY-like chemotaxis protein
MAGRRRILVADDNAEVRKSLRRLFANHPRLEICDEAADGRDAVEKAAKLDPDLVILDLSMPVMDGLQAAKAICKILPNVPIILFTLHAQAIRPSDIERSCIVRVVAKEEANTLVRHAEDLLRAV